MHTLWPEKDCLWPAGDRMHPDFLRNIICDLRHHAVINDPDKEKLR